MKRLGSSETLIPIRPALPGGGDGMYGRGFADDDECGGGGGGREKKRRLSVEQVRALDKNFEAENKLDPERKVRLAQELGLQPRQVAVWFQNRRARWKTKQLESDYAALKANYDALRLDFDALRRDNKSLTTQIKQLNGKLAEDSSSVKEEEELEPVESDPLNLISDSDSSAVLNDNPSPHNNAVTSTTAVRSGCLSWSPFAAPEPKPLIQPLLKQEEYGFLAGDDPCSSALFLDEQPPALAWCGPDQWSWMDAGGENNKGRKEGAY